MEGIERRVEGECVQCSAPGVRASSNPPVVRRSSGRLDRVIYPRMRMLGGTAHRDGRQTAADTRREVARLQQCCRAPVPLPFPRARWRASVIVAPSRSRPGNGGEPRYARSSQLDSHPVVATASARQRTRHRPNHPYHRIVDSRRDRSCIVLAASVDT